MEILILDKDFKAISTLDTFESLIWTSRYNEYGDFEIYTPANSLTLSILQQDNYVWLKEDQDRLMVIEDIKIKFNAESGNYLIVTGRSLESILNRRIIWSQTVLTGNMQLGIKKLLDENAISPIIENRKIPNLIFEMSTDPNITELTIEAQFTRNNLYDTIQKICSSNDIGFNIRLNDEDKLVFSLYSGKDRSYYQLLNPYVIFSPQYENLISSDYNETKKLLKTLTVVAGEGEGEDRKTIVIGNSQYLDRREMYTDARDLSQTVDGVLISDAEYYAQLAQRGIADLYENTSSQTFDGQVDATKTFKYKEDFFMGDIVQLSSDYGIEGRTRVTEVIYSQDQNGQFILPRFSILTDDPLRDVDNSILLDKYGDTLRGAI